MVYLIEAMLRTFGSFNSSNLVVIFRLLGKYDYFLFNDFLDLASNTREEFEGMHLLYYDYWSKWDGIESSSLSPYHYKGAGSPKPIP